MRQPSGVGKPLSFPSVSSMVGSRYFPCSPLLEPPDKNCLIRLQSLYRCLTGKAWFRHGPLSNFLKWFGVPSVGFQPPLRSAVAMSESSCRCFLVFLLAKRLETPSPVPSSRLALPSRQSKIAPTASSPKAWLVAMSRSYLVVHRPLHPSL